MDDPNVLSALVRHDEQCEQLIISALIYIQCLGVGLAIAYEFGPIIKYFWDASMSLTGKMHLLLIKVYVVFDKLDGFNLKLSLDDGDIHSIHVGEDDQMQ